MSPRAASHAAGYVGDAEIPLIREILNCFEQAEVLGLNHFGPGGYECYWNKNFWQKKLTNFGVNR